MPLLIEALGNEQWVEIGKLSDQDVPGSIRHTEADGKSLV